LQKVPILCDAAVLYCILRGVLGYAGNTKMAHFFDFLRVCGGAEGAAAHHPHM